MTKEYILSLDAGTGSCRAVLFDLKGNQVALTQEEWIHKGISRYPGSQNFDTNKNWKRISYCIKQVIEKADISSDAIKAVSSSSMREGMVLYDETGEEIWACPNVDGRASVEAEELIEKNFANEIYFEAGDWVSITAPSRLMWIKRHQPDIYKKVSKLTMLSDWILYKLSGEFATDYSIASSSGLLNISRRTWSEKIIGILELNENILPEIYESGTVIGTVHERACEETGLTKGTPVVLGGADTQLGLVGIGQVETEQFTIVGGSFWQSTVILDEPLIDRDIRLRTLCHTIPDKWMMEGVGFYSGLVMRWFRDAFCEYEKMQAKNKKIDSYVLMEKLASKVPPGSNGVMGMFGSVMDAKKWVHPSPAFVQFDINNPANSGKKESIRAIQENAAYIVNGHKKIIEEITNKKHSEVIFTGGGAKGNLWPQIIADVLGVIVKVPEIKESSSLGAALYGGIGVGAYRNLENSVNVKIEKQFQPNKINHEIYTELFERWKDSSDYMYGLVAKGLTKPLGGQ